MDLTSFKFFYDFLNESKFENKSRIIYKKKQLYIHI